MAGVDRAQEANAFGAAPFAQHDPVGAQAQRGLQQFVGGDLGFAQFALDRDQPDAVFAGQPELGRILDQHDAFVTRDFAEHGVEERRLAGACPTRDEDGAPLADRLTQKGDRLSLRIGHGVPPLWP